MFLENDFARPLFDFVKGGPPRAFQCLMCPSEDGKQKVTRTERGMRMHLKSKHNWEEQPCLYSTDNPSRPKSGAPRKLRAGPPNLNQNDTSEKPQDKQPKPRKSAEMSANESLSFMREEN